MRFLARSIGPQSFLVCSKSSKVNETRLKDQLLLLNMEMNCEDNYILF